MDGSIQGRLCGRVAHDVVQGGEAPHGHEMCIRDRITALKEDLEPVSDRIRVTASRAELDENLAAGRISVLLSLEGLDPLGNDLSLLRTFYDLGVRGAGLTWSRRNAFADVYKRQVRV